MRRTSFLTEHLCLLPPPPCLPAQVLFQYVPDGAVLQPRLAGLGAELRPAPTMKQAKTDLNVFVSGTGHVSVDYMAEIFDEATIESLTQSYVRLLDAAAEAPDASVWMLPLGVNEAALVDFCQDAMRPDYLTGPLAFEKFEALAASQPERDCLVFEGQSLTYGTVNLRANALANALLALGVGPDVPVGIMLDRSFDLPTAFLAAMKVGGSLCSRRQNSRASGRAASPRAATGPGPGCPLAVPC